MAIEYLPWQCNMKVILADFTPRIQTKANLPNIKKKKKKKEEYSFLSYQLL